MNKLKRFIALALVLCMVMAWVPVSANAAASDDFLRVFHLDCGRRFFSLSEVKSIIDTMSANGYTHLELAIGNDALRLLLDDMSVEGYAHADVVAGIQAGNKGYSHSGEWTQSEMDEIIAYAKAANIEIIPLVNTPGHMDSIITAMEYVGLTSPAYGSSVRTVDVTDEAAVAFTQALVGKYAAYFASKGCTYFNMGADEYANDAYTSGSMGFGHLQSAGLYDEYAAYVNGVSSVIKAAGLTPIAFNDGFYFNNQTSVEFDTDIVIAYWTSGWSGYTVASAATVAGKGHKILNTNDAWYYVVGRSTGNTYSYTTALSGAQNTAVTDVSGSNDPEVIGAMNCAWYDTPSVSYASYEDDVHTLIETLAQNNSDYYVVTESETVEDATVSDGDVSITAPGLTGVTADVTDAPAIEGASEVIAYTVVPETAEGAYAGEATVSVTVPADWTTVRGGVLASANGEEQLGITGDLANGMFTFKVPHFSTVVVYNVAPAAEGETIDGGEVVLEVDGTATKTISGANYSGNYSVADPTVVSVAVTGQDAVASSVKYTAASVTCNDLISNNSTEVATSYYYTPDNGANYYPLYASRSRSISWSGLTYTYTWYYHNGSSLVEIGTQETTSTSTTPNITVYNKGGTEATPASTTITFTGLKPGTTTVTVGGTYVYTVTVNYKTQAVSMSVGDTVSYTQSAVIEGEPSFTVEGVATAAVSGSTVTFTAVANGTTVATVGNTKYTITVSDEVPDDALTSTSVTLEYWITNADVTANNSTSMTITTSTAGVTTDEGAVMTNVAPATGSYEWSSELVYWKSVRLDEDHHQVDLGDDQTEAGTNFTHIRYHNGAWQYKDEAGTWNYFLSGDQLVAYYLQPTDVTTQIEVLTKDWGLYPDNNTEDPAAGQIGLSFAVVDGNTLTPTEENIYANSTVIFNYWADRDIGLVAPQNNGNYEIYKITVTSGTRAASSPTQWSDSETINWAKKTVDLGDGETRQWYDEREVWNINDGTEAIVNGVEDNVVWPSKDTAFLILIYIRASNADLNVKYVDDSLDGALIYERGVYADDDGTFVTDLVQTSDVPESGYFTLDDDATLTYYNESTSETVVQRFDKSLLTFQDIAPQYRSGAYYYVGAEIADDGKTLILHYDIDETKLNPKYVVDFGLSVDVPLSEVIDNAGDASKIEVVSAAFGSAVINGDTLTYTPDSVLLTPAAVPVQATYSNGTVAIRNLGFIPATTVYYEEGFATLAGTWTAGSTGSGKQTTQTATNNVGNYGYDAKYAAETGMSNGTQAVSTASGDTAELTFTGTGIDVYANCDTTTSTVAVLLYSGNSLKKIYQVDTSAVSGLTAATAGQDITSYSLPIVSIQGLDHGTYRIVIQHTKKALNDDNTENTAEFRLDGFRVYNTLTDMTDYAADENAPSFVELRNAVLAGVDITESSASDPYNWSGTIIEQVYNNEGTLTGALVLKDSASVDKTDLLENGPKNELFLRKGESVSFTLASGVTAQIGLKAVNGSVSYTVNGTSGTVTTSTDMFYLEGSSGKITIVNNSDNLLSVTKLKVFGAASAAEALEPISEELVIHALQTMGVIEKPEPVNPFADVSEDSWYYDAVMWAVKNGITTGADDTHFLPNALCQRASVVTFLWRAAGSPEPETQVNPFVDVKEGDFFYKAVLWAVENGITNGSDATHFNPFGNANRAQVVTFLWRANGQPVVEAEIPFTDVAEGQWYTQAVAWAVANNITNGMTATEFGVNANCNRAQIVTFLYRASLIAE